MKININFGGFYESLHSGNIDSRVEMEAEHFDKKDYWETVNYKATFIEYAKDYLNKLCSEYNINAEFIQLDSPKFYNYSTDSIRAEIVGFDWVKEIDTQDFKDRVKEATTSVSGYIPFYDYEDVINQIDERHKEVYYECVMDVLCNMFNEEHLDKIEFEIILNEEKEK